MSRNTPPRPRRQGSGDEARDRREPPETELHDMGGNPAPDDPDVRSGVTAGLNSDGGHVTADGDWSESGEEDPDAGSGRTWE